MTAPEDVFLTHREPVWRDRSNFIIMAALPETGRFEQLWARQESADLFEVCCIPFFEHNLALGDVVRTGAEGEKAYVMKDVVRPSGRWTFRVWLGESPEDRLGVEAEMFALGTLTEWFSPNLLAVDAETETLAQRLADALADGERRGRWVYETGRL